MTSHPINTKEAAIRPDGGDEAILKIYDEICRSYHAVDDFRMKLLGLLPFASLIGIFGLNHESLFGKSVIPAGDIISYISAFAALFTLILFAYEIRGALRCSGLIKKGERIERELLKIPGQFSQCVEEYNRKVDERDNKAKDANYNKVKDANDNKAKDANKKDTPSFPEKLRNYFNSKIIACSTYSFVFAAWLFVALKFGFEFSTGHCIFWAFLTGFVIGFVVYRLFFREVVAA